MALDREDILSRITQTEGPRADLSGLDLSGADLSRLDLRGVDLSRADLSAADLRWAVLEGADWLTAAQVSELAGLSTSNPSAQPNKWKRQRQVFAVHHNGVDYFPGYGLDPEAGYRPRKAMKSILEVFGETKDGWGLAYWFLSANSLLGGRRPQDVLSGNPEQVLAAARDEIEDVAHA